MAMRYDRIDKDFRRRRKYAAFQQADAKHHRVVGKLANRNGDKCACCHLGRDPRTRQQRALITKACKLLYERHRVRHAKDLATDSVTIKCALDLLSDAETWHPRCD
jgi:hypothetical protein